MKYSVHGRLNAFTCFSVSRIDGENGRAARTSPSVHVANMIIGFFLKVTNTIIC
jgi:hypothetical protein